MLDSAERLGCITLAFGISDVFKSLLNDNTDHDYPWFDLTVRYSTPAYSWAAITATRWKFWPVCKRASS